MHLQRPTARWPQPHVKLVAPGPTIRRHPDHPYSTQAHEEYPPHRTNSLHCRAPSILPSGPMDASVTAEPSPKPCGLLRRWRTVSLNPDWKTVIAVYLPVAQVDAVASPPHTSLFARSLRLPSSQRRTVPPPPCSVISEDGIGTACPVVNMSVRTAAPDRSATRRHVPIGCASEQGTGHPAANAS